MSKKFEKKSEIVKVEFFDREYNINVNSEEIPILFVEASEAVDEIKKTTKANDFESVREYMGALTDKNKRVYEKTINAILQDETACENIFKNDKSMAFYDQVYSFIVDVVSEAQSQNVPSYSPNRAQRRA